VEHGVDEARLVAHGIQHRHEQAKELLPGAGLEVEEHDHHELP
jgi:hypothetical protein